MAVDTLPNGCFRQKTSGGAIKATLFFNIAHYALRPWPWILVALCSLIVFPNLESLQAAFPHIDAKIVNDDLAYPAMLQKLLPPGWLGLVLASSLRVIPMAFLERISRPLLALVMNRTGSRYSRVPPAVTMIPSNGAWLGKPRWPSACRV